MNLTMTRAAQAVCAEPGFALRSLHHNPATEPERTLDSHDAHGYGPAIVEVQREPCVIESVSEVLGMVLLGIGYETSVA